MVYIGDGGWERGFEFVKVGRDDCVEVCGECIALDCAIGGDAIYCESNLE